jgi:hypothetical protein
MNAFFNQRERGDFNSIVTGIADYSALLGPA